MGNWDDEWSDSSLPLVPFSYVNKKCRVVHLSEDKFDEYHPRVPRGVWEDDTAREIEDTTTKRVSFAPTIEQALIAISSKLYCTLPSLRGKPCPMKTGLRLARKALNDPVWIYCIPKIDKVKLFDTAKHFKSCPHSVKNPYGPNFDSEKSNLRRRLTKEDFRGCVPDAKWTHEMWLTRKHSAKRIGQLIGVNKVLLHKDWLKPK